MANNTRDFYQQAIIAEFDDMSDNELRAVIDYIDYIKAVDENEGIEYYDSPGDSDLLDDQPKTSRSYTIH